MSAKATTIKKLFSRQTTVSIDIAADPEKVWNILCDGSSYTKWNSTILSLDGKIGPNKTIKLVSKLAPKRTFTLKVKVFEPNSTLVWGDTMGERTFRLKEINKQTNFIMTEKIGGPLFPLFSNKIPSFDESFEAFARDLKQEAEVK